MATPAQATLEERMAELAVLDAKLEEQRETVRRLKANKAPRVRRGGVGYLVCRADCVGVLRCAG